MSQTPVAKARPDTFGDLLALRLRDSPDRPFVTVSGRTLTYAQFGGLVLQLAGSLAALSVSSGDKVALFLPNGLPFLLSMFAVPYLGGIFVPVHAQCVSRELEYIIQHSDSRLAITDLQRLSLVEAIRTQCPSLEQVIVVGASASSKGVVSFDALTARQMPDAPGTTGSDMAAILYTSGTTGRPKGAILTHRSFLLGGTAFGDYLGIQPTDALYCVLPLAHINGLRSSVMAAATAGAQLVIGPRFSASDFWDRVRAHQITMFSILPTIMSILLARPPDTADRAHRVRLCISPATPALLQAFEARFGVLVVSTYGLTEGVLNFMNPPDSSRRRVAAVGRPIAPPVQEVRIIDAKGYDLPPGMIGEIIMRNPAMFMGYYKDPETTVQTLRDGWLHTGDLGWMDDDGFLYFATRKKEMIRRGGENVSPGDIESVLLEHPKVIEAVVVGVPDSIYEEEIKACVILRSGESAETVSPAELFRFCRSRLAAFKVPRYLEYRREFPRTPTLRVQRHLLRASPLGNEATLFDRLAMMEGTPK